VDNVDHVIHIVVVQQNAVHWRKACFLRSFYDLLRISGHGKTSGNYLYLYRQPGKLLSGKIAMGLARRETGLIMEVA
jgi:hypothetical protein